MILTRKAKEDFIKWYYSKCDKQPFFQDYSLDLANVILNALIIEWFDSVGIYIEVFIYTDTIVNFKSYINKEVVVGDYGFVYFKTRQEAIEQAIKKANEIYNEM